MPPYAGSGAAPSGAALNKYGNSNHVREKGGRPWACSASDSESPVVHSAGSS